MCGKDKSEPTITKTHTTVNKTQLLGWYPPCSQCVRQPIVNLDDTHKKSYQVNFSALLIADISSCLTPFPCPDISHELKKLVYALCRVVCHVPCSSRSRDPSNLSLLFPEFLSKRPCVSITSLIICVVVLCTVLQAVGFYLAVCNVLRM